MLKLNIRMFDGEVTAAGSTADIQTASINIEDVTSKLDEAFEALVKSFNASENELAWFEELKSDINGYNNAQYQGVVKPILTGLSGSLNIASTTYDMINQGV